jgi:hypothetical protein
MSDSNRTVAWPVLLIPLMSMLLSGCVRPSTRRAHEANMAKAEEFKREFDRENQPGTALDAVMRWREARGLPPTDLLRSADGTGDIRLELLREESPWWYCGKGSVGLGLRFVERKLDKSTVTFWSFDCP